MGDQVTDLTDERIFGNDAGDDEDIDLLNHYFLEQRSFERFYDGQVPLRIVTARKGTGKSALLRRARSIAENSARKNITISVKGADIMPDTSSPSVSSNLIDAWKQKICTRINREIGARIKLAANDDTITLVEASELDGFRQRNIVSALADRMKLQLQAGSLSLETGKLAAANDVALLERYSKEEDYVVWLFVDDIDATFRNTPDNRAVIGAFFSACRDLVQRVTGLVIRCSVRTDVWTIVHASDEALDKCEQYIYNLRWDNQGVEEILINKVYSYFALTNPSDLVFKSASEQEKKLESLRAIFPTWYSWGKGGRISPSRFLSLLSQGRPRWTSKLCRASAEHAFRARHVLVEEGDVQAKLASYSLKRRQDLVSEHSYEYPEFNSLLQIFANWKRKFTSQELLKRVNEFHIKRIPGTGQKPDPVALAHLLYRAGFINAVRQRPKAKPEYYEFEDRPGLLMSRGDLDEGCDWEIPMFLRKEFGI